MDPNGQEGATAVGAEATGSVMLPDYQTYAGVPNHVAEMRVRASLPGALKENELKAEILKQQLECLALVKKTLITSQEKMLIFQPDPASWPDLPAEVDNFTDLCPLEAPPSNPHLKSSTFGYVTSVYRATDMRNGRHVVLRRVHGYRLTTTKCTGLVEQWKKLVHANLVTMRHAFTTKSFGDQSMVFAHDYWPGAGTLMSKHFGQQHGHSQHGQHHQGGNRFDAAFGGSDGARPYSQQKNQLLRQHFRGQQQGLPGASSTDGGRLSEALIWMYVIQLTSALRHIHSSGLALRALDPTKILVTGPKASPRLLLNCGGVFDVLMFDAMQQQPPVAHYQQEDLIALGKIVLGEPRSYISHRMQMLIIILALACNSFLAIQRENLQTSMEIVTSSYSGDLRNLIMYLLTNPARVKSVNDLMPMIGARFYTQLDALYLRGDHVEQELARDVESARLFRLLTKVCTVVDRAELNGDYSWAEYGDRYMLKLFRDYVFHQVRNTILLSSGH